MPSRMVNLKELSVLLDVTRMTVTKLTKNHDLPLAVKGKQGAQHQYDISHVFRWYGRWEASKVLTNGQSKGNIIDLKAEEARLKRHQADKAEVEAQKAKGEVLIVEDVKDALNDIAVSFGSQLDALGGRLSNELAALTDPAEIRQVLFEESRRIRAATADALEALVDGTVAEGGDIGEGASAEDGGHMGGRESDITSGVSGAGPMAFLS